jgi:hypothetical protein
MTLFLTPCAIVERYWDARNQIDWFARKPDLEYPVFVHVIIGENNKAVVSSLMRNTTIKLLESSYLFCALCKSSF